jgi:hypothetical protein
MAQLTAERIKNALIQNTGSLDSTDETMLKNLLFRRVEKVRLFDAATAGTAMTTSAFWKNTTGVTMRVVSAYVVAPVAVAADNTDYDTFTLAKVDSAGANAATVASGDTRAASLSGLAANAPEALTLTDANKDIADGWSLTAAVAKAGAGKAITAATSDAYLIVVLEPVT